jgi:hypothetical protein
MSHVLLLDQREMRYYGSVSLFNEMGDTHVLSASRIRGKVRHA